jgi:hypothetical protein
MEGNTVLKWSPLQIGGMVVVLFCTTGAECPQRIRPAHPVIFTSHPDLSQLLNHIGHTSDSIRRLSVDGVQLRIEGAPVALRSSIEYERPNRFKLTGSFMATSELNVGSNEQFLWIWGRHAPGALLYVRHDQYDQTIAHQLMPVPPSWLIEALGVLSIDPLGQYSGPILLENGYIEIQSKWFAGRGEPLSRTLVIDPKYGFVVEQQIRDGQGRLLASSVASAHRHYPEWNVSLPSEVDVQINVPGQQMPFRMSLDIGEYTINGLGPPDPQFWTMPDAGNYPVYDLSDPSVQRQLLGITTNSPPRAIADQRGEFRFQYRGYTQPSTMRR